MTSSPPETPVGTIRDCIALITAFLADDEPHLDHVIEDMVNDLNQVDTNDVVTALIGLCISLLEQLATANGTTAQALWRDSATRIVTRLEEGPTR